jgi:SAM-dependent methyltransferase
VRFGSSTATGLQFRARIRRLGLVLSLTPLHPQWFSFRAKRYAANCVADAATGSFLDVGCADGALRSRVEGCSSYVGLDYPVTGQALYGARPDVFADAAILPFNSNVFDGVALLDVLEHLPEPRASLCEIARVLRQGGKLFVNVPCFYPLHDEPHDYQRPTVHGLRYWLQQAGFRVDHIQAQGAPAETLALLTNIVLARTVVRASLIFPPAFALLAPLLPIFALVNLIGWGWGCLDRKDSLMPFAYWAIACRESPAVDDNT